MTSEWRTRAACRGHDTEAWFPVSRSAKDTEVAAAKAFCRRCPVQPACLRWALESGEQHGIYGGFTADERRAINRRRAAA
jgi:WhiB family redox-sensing transcriptional regulator